MLNKFRYGVSVFAVSVALAFGVVGIDSAQAALSSSVQSQVDAALATGSDTGKVQAISGIAAANRGDTADIAAAAAVVNLDLAPAIAGQLAAQLPTQEAKNALVLAVITAIGEAHPDQALEVSVLVVAAVPGSEGILQNLIQTAAGGPFGDPTPQSPGEPVGPRVRNQTSDQIPFYREVTQTTQSVSSTSPFEETDDGDNGDDGCGPICQEHRGGGGRGNPQ